MGGPQAARERTQALWAARLGGLVHRITGERPTVEPWGAGATARSGGSGWVYAAERPERSLGPALAWARRHGVDRLHVVVDGSAGILARRAAAFRRPVTVWVLRGADLQRAEPEPLDPPPPPPEDALARWAEVIRRAGAEPVVEHGVLTGDVLGLEVVRVVPAADGPRLEVGIGRHDREAFAILHGDEPPEEALARVVRHVSGHRRPGAPPHPLNRLAASRWLRARLIDRPGLVGARSLEPVAPPLPRPNVKDAAPCVAAGVDTAGRPLVVVCSVGVDLDVVPTAVDARALDGRHPRCLVVVPERDLHPVTRALAAELIEPVELVGVPDDWRSL